jgi:hypothetical protein
LISYFNESARNLKLKRQVEMMKSLQREAREKKGGSSLKCLESGEEALKIQVQAFREGLEDDWKPPISCGVI